MEKQETKTASPYELDGRPPLKVAIPLGLQYVLAMFVGNLTHASDYYISLRNRIGGDLQVALLQNAMLIAGIITLLQVFTIGPVGQNPQLLWEQVLVSLMYVRVLPELWGMG